MILTTQRRMMVDELKKLKCHPTAEEFYEIIRRKTPKVSLASVYRNLEVLSKSGLIRKVEVGGTQMRFDGDTSQHSHLKCSSCGRVIDFIPKGAESLDKYLRETKRLNRNVMDMNIVFMGKCGKCG
ncbi:MAG TPA: transcriptional repressor [Lentisphaeria bacterium]|nr:MAG: hypothetical protein A2X45_20005 [Lentisphaerae bacterium GWF2_50_93]HCE44102.1 transcriptional repressor [Lentisphaeria bacterium]